VLASVKQLGSDLSNGDTLAALVSFKRGGHALLSAILATRSNGRFAVYCSQGWVEVRDKAHPGGARRLDAHLESPARERRPCQPHRLRAGIGRARQPPKAFADAALGQAPYPVPQAQMVANISALEAIFKSARSGAIEAVEDDDETGHVHDAAAPPGPQRMGNAGRDREAVILADRLGFEEAFVGEHVTDLAENVTSSMMFLAASRMPRRKSSSAPATINMPNAHRPTWPRRWRCSTPDARPADQWASAPAGLMSDAEVFGQLQKDRNAIFLESINMVLAIWKATHRTSCTASTFTSAPRRR